MRIDKFLWAVRVYKTRSQASEACRKGRVKLNGGAVKPGKEVAVGDRIVVRKKPIEYTYKVLDIPKSRVGAKLVPNYISDQTP